MLMIVSFDVILTGDLPSAALRGRYQERNHTPKRTSHGGESNSPPVSSAMPPCFDKWCKRFDDSLKALRTLAKVFSDTIENLLFC